MLHNHIATECAAPCRENKQMVEIVRKGIGASERLCRITILSLKLAMVVRHVVYALECSYRCIAKTTRPKIGASNNSMRLQWSDCCGGRVALGSPD